MTRQADKARPQTAVGRWLATRRRRAGHLYDRRFRASVRVQLVALVALIEAIFLAERFPMVFREVLKNHADLFDTLLILICVTTQIVDFALAISVLVAVYWTILQMREDRELLVLASAGTGPRYLLGMTLTIAVAAQLGSLAVSGVVDPISRYAQRSILFDAELRVLKHGGASGQLLYLGDRVAYSPPAVRHGWSLWPADPGKPVFIFDKPDAETFRVVTADRTGITGPDSSGNMALRLEGFTSRIFTDEMTPARRAPPPPRPNAVGVAGGFFDDLEPSGLSASDFGKSIALAQLLPFPPRGTEPVEHTVFEQAFPPEPVGAPERVAEMRVLGERVSRSLLCLLAAPIALAAVCLTGRRTSYVALPAASMLLLSLDVASEALIRALRATELGAALLPLIVLTAGIAVILVAIVLSRQARLVLPQLARA